MKIWIYNFGQVEIEIADIYVNNVRCDSSLFTGKLLLGPDELPEMITISIPSTISGPDYHITIVTTRGVKNVSEWTE
jgi:hypothetical protein